MNKINIRTVFIWAAVISFGLAYLLFSRTVSGGDNEAHIQFAVSALETGKYPPHFLYHFALNLLSGFSGDRHALETISALLLSLAVSVKIYISLLLLAGFYKSDHKEMPLRTAVICAFALFFAGPMINWWQFPIIYKGQFTPNIWHNPTSVLLMPFAVSIIFLIFRQVNALSVKSSLTAALLLALSVLIKPNLALIMIPAMLALLPLKKISIKDYLIIAFPAAAILAWQFIQNYTAAGTMTIAHHKSSIIFSPLTVWKSWTATPFGAALVSFGFTGCFIYFYSGRVKQNKFLIFSLALTAISLFYFLLLAESGEKLKHGNFFWGTVPALYMLFMSCIYELTNLKPGSTKTESLAYLACSILLILHLAGGILFYIRTLLGNSFYA